MSLIDSLNQYLEQISTWSGNVSPVIGNGLNYLENISVFYTLLVRWIFPVLAILVLFRCMVPLLNQTKNENEWGYLEIPGSLRLPLKHWENSIGRSKLSDVIINLPFISRSHAVLSYRNKGWTVYDLGSKGGVSVNGNKVEGSAPVYHADRIAFASAEFVLNTDEDEDYSLESDSDPDPDWNMDEKRSSRLKRKIIKFPNLGEHAKNISPGKTFLMIIAFQLLGALQVSFTMGTAFNLKVPMTFVLFAAIEFIYYKIMSWMGRTCFEVEFLCFFLCGLNLLIVAAAAPTALSKQLTAIILGMAAYTFLSFVVLDLGRARKLKYILASGALLLILINLLVGETRFGAKNWINLGLITFQPMELVKVSFVIAGTATLDKLLTTRNLTAFIAFSGTCIGTLILIRDLGMAVIFFGAFLVIAFMRSGDLRTISLISAGAVLGAAVVVIFMPYIASRFAAWGHVWEYYDTTGYQQTRTMIAAASGGLLGTGGGNGNLIKVPAADTDLVFGMLCEEWGLLIGLAAVLIIIFFGIYAVIISSGTRSAFYAIAACGAASIFLIQTALNVFGSLDLLPLTGVTLPFVSNGGSSMISSWCLLAFIKSADERCRPDTWEYFTEEEE